MKLRRLIASASAAGLLALSAGPAMAADSISVTNTGPGSNNQASVNNNQTVNETNNNTVTVVNANTQSATTGAANVSGNTNGGSAVSGNATNNNTTTTTVSVNNNSVLGGGALNTGTGGGTGGGNLSTAQGTGGGSLGTGGGVGGGALPETGALNPLDVSGLRALADQSGSGARTDLAAILLSIAAILSLAGAIGSAAYAAKKIVA